MKGRLGRRLRDSGQSDPRDKTGCCYFGMTVPIKFGRPFYGKLRENDSVYFLKSAIQSISVGSQLSIMAVTDGKTNSSPTHKPIREFSPSEESSIRAKLESPIPAEGIAYRSSGGGQVAYIEGWRAFNYANEIFGFNGWSSEILNFTTDFLDEEAGKVSVGVSCTVRITLKDGTFHDVT